VEKGSTKVLKCIDEFLIFALLNSRASQSHIRLIGLKLRCMPSDRHNCKDAIIGEFLSKKTQFSKGQNWLTSEKVLKDLSHACIWTTWALKIKLMQFFLLADDICKDFCAISVDVFEAAK